MDSLLVSIVHGAARSLNAEGRPSSGCIVALAPFRRLGGRRRGHSLLETIFGGCS